MKPTKILIACTFVSLLLFGYSNCAPPAQQGTNPYATLGSSIPTIKVTPENPTVNWGSATQFTASGGEGPYSYNVLYGGGSVTSSGLFTAPSYNQGTVIQVTDKNGAVTNVQVTVGFLQTGSLSLSYSPNPIRLGEPATLTASGGTAPYRYVLISGSGMISGSTFTGSSYGSSNVGVIDSRGVQSAFTISVSSGPTVVTAPIYRLSSVQARFHLYSRSSTEGTSSGWTFEGTAFKVLTAPSLNTGTLVRCLVPTSGIRFLSSSGTCGSYNMDGTLGYIYSYNAVGTLVLYSCFNNKTGDFISTTNSAECTSNGYGYSSTLGYVYPAN